MSEKLRCPGCSEIKEPYKRKISWRGKKTIIFATHNLQEVEEICDRIAIINKGEIKKIGTVKEIKKSFDSDKNYIIHLDNFDNRLLEDIGNLAFVNEVHPHSYDGSTEVHVKITGENSTLSQVIQHIIAGGGQISLIYEKEISLEQVLLKIVDS